MEWDRALREGHEPRPAEAALVRGRHLEDQPHHRPLPVGIRHLVEGVVVPEPVRELGQEDGAVLLQGDPEGNGFLDDLDHHVFPAGTRILSVSILAPM